MSVLELASFVGLNAFKFSTQKLNLAKMELKVKPPLISLKIILHLLYKCSKHQEYLVFLGSEVTISVGLKQF